MVEMETQLLAEAMHHFRTRTCSDEESGESVILMTDKESIMWTNFKNTSLKTRDSISFRTTFFRAEDAPFRS